MEFAMTFIGLALAGLFIGVCAGLLGIGGGTIIIPLLRLVFGLDAFTATATSLFTIIPTSASAAVSHVRNKTCIPKLGIALGLGGSITSSLGVYLSSLSPAWAVMLAASVVILYSAFTMLRKALKLPRDGEEAAAGGGASGRVEVTKAGPGAETPVDDAVIARGALGDEVAASEAAASKADNPEAEAPGAAAGGERPVTRRTLVFGLLIGLITGVCAGYVGVGGGFLMVPLMTSWLNLPMKKAGGTSIIAIIILAIPGVIGQMMLGHVDYLAGIMLAAGSIPGATLGAKLVPRMRERHLRFLFAGFLMVGGCLLFFNELGLF